MALLARLLPAWDSSDRALLFPRWLTDNVPISIACNPGNAVGNGVKLEPKYRLSDATYSPGSLTATGLRARVTVNLTV